MVRINFGEPAMPPASTNISIGEPEGYVNIFGEFSEAWDDGGMYKKSAAMRMNGEQQRRVT
jgi:hypothetical protein